jgi:putative transposase
VVKPSVKKEACKYLRKKYAASIESICAVFRLTRATWYYTSKLNDSEVIKKLKEHVEKHPNRGFDNYYKRIKREGYKWSRNRVLRVYREMGLVRRPKKRRRLPEGLRKPLYTAQKLNEVWSMDFMSDSFEDGRTLRVLNIIDDHNRESLAIKGGLSMPSTRVIRILEQLKEEIGLPNYIRTDNGPEFISKEYKTWCKTNGITPVYAFPGTPTENAFIERFNRLFREDVLDAYLFTNKNQFELIAEKWRMDYNNFHPHSSLGDQSPIEYSNRCQLLSGNLNSQIEAVVNRKS